MVRKRSLFGVQWKIVPLFIDHNIIFFWVCIQEPVSEQKTAAARSAGFSSASVGENLRWQ